MSSSRKPELLAPAGNWDCVRAAAANGADAVYFGLPTLNARLRADNFTAEDLPRLMPYLHDRGLKGYVTLNTLVFTDELPVAAELLRLLDQAGVDAAIVQDLGLVELARQLVPHFPIHASTQMTLTSPEGLEFAKRLGITRAVLARELSLRELEKIQKNPVLPLEVFVHGALCVAYSGQCLTSEALGQRSANRGECAQACRLPYQLIVDGALQDLGDRRYLLSPQDLAAVAEIPRLTGLGIESFKIEGRLKTPEYVAAVTQVYRKAIDAAWKQQTDAIDPSDLYKLEMTFSRGLYPGWLHGVNHQELVHARFGKKRGPLLGLIGTVGHDHIELDRDPAARPGDGLVFDTGGDTDQEQGGRIYQVRGRKLYFEHGKIRFTELQTGHRVWKTDDPQLERELRKSFQQDAPAKTRPLHVHLQGSAGHALQVTVHSAGHTLHLLSDRTLEAARNQPLTEENCAGQFSRLGGTPYHLEKMSCDFAGPVILPVSELNRLRREMVLQLDQLPPAPVPAPGGSGITLEQVLQKIPRPTRTPRDEITLSVLCRSLEQLDTALACGCTSLYADFEDIRRYREAVERVRQQSGSLIYLATPRIQKAGEEGFFKLIDGLQPDGVLVRNPGALSYFQNSPLRRLGDFSLNVANPLTAAVFMRENLEALTLSYDLDFNQVLDLLRQAPPDWFELTLHQHMPLFHMEHCVFAAFLSKGTDHTNCGRPCDRHQIKLRDRVGAEHPVKADVGCRNTVFHQKAQSGAGYYAEFYRAGLRRYRLELLNENAAQTRDVLETYRNFTAGLLDANELTTRLKAQSQLGVTSGTLTVLGG